MNALLVDIGNSRTKWRIVATGSTTPGQAPRWIGEERVLASKALDGIAASLAQQAGVPVDAAYVSSVASSDALNTVERGIQATWRRVEMHRVTPDAARCGVINGYREPARLGPDRWLAMIGAHAIEPDRSILVCSFGTATTIDFLRSAGPGEVRSVGGLILPGIQLMHEVLATSTARLPLAEGAVVDFADNTADAIASGIVAAQAGAVVRAFERATAVMCEGPPGEPLLCMLAGGASAIVANAFTAVDLPFVVVHDLVLRGLAAFAADRSAADARAPMPLAAH